MSKESSGKGSASRASKRARFDDQQQGRSSGASPAVLVAGIVVVVLVIGGTVFGLTRLSSANGQTEVKAPESLLDSDGLDAQPLLVSAATQGHDPYPLAVAEDGALQFPLSAFDDYAAHHYTYMHEGRPIEFFVLKSKDGVVRAAFNACDVCYLSKKGYTQEGDVMICNNCGRRFPADQINVVHGGCNPSPLDRSVEGDSLIIKVEDVVRGQEYF